MFKYIRTIHSSSPIETVCMPKTSGITYAFGSFCQMSGGALINGCTVGKPAYLLLEKSNSPEKNDTFKCLRLAPGMVFETTYEGETTPVIGDLATFYIGSDDSCCSVTSGGTAFEIVGVRTEGTNTVVTVISN